VSELSPDLSSLLFSSYFGDSEIFSIRGLGVGPSGNLIVGGATGDPQLTNTGPENVWVNSINLAPLPALRVDSIVNAASLLSGAISAGETIVVQGAGFASDAQLMIGGSVAPALSVTPTAITATVPQGLPEGPTGVQVQSGGAASNQVLAPVAETSPGIFSQDGSGYGQGYILNKDGTLNTPSNPAHPGEPFTVYATGVGPVSFTDGYAVTAYPVAVLVDGWYCNGIAAVMGPVDGLPGSVYRISMYMPSLAQLTTFDSPLPPSVSVTIGVALVSSQPGLSISVAP
jgi:uncharacterized protein (TIGR03437 family)